MKILIADDDKVSRVMLAANAKHWGYEVILAENGQQAWDIMQEDDAPQLLLLDWEMPEMDGIEVCESIMARKSERFVYILMLTSRNTSDDIVECLSKGASDYIPKPFNSDELKVRLQVGKRMIDLQGKLNKALQEITALSQHDPLTGLLNRRAIMDALPKEVNRAKRHDQIIFVAMLDIDHFKKINDTYGHFVGDEVLKIVTTRMSDSLREYDLLARYGGEEFLAVTAVDSIENGIMVYQRICDAISQKPVDVNGVLIPVTISCGVTHCLPKYATDQIDKLLITADDALYQAKHSGRNKVVFKKFNI